jgi:hypothetical protein
MTEDRKIDLMMKATKAANPLVRWLLKSSLLHGLVSKDILLLHFQGRNSGRWYDTPVTYIEDGNRLRILTETAWWKNLRDCPDIKLTLRGSEVAATANVHSDGGSYVADSIAELLRRVPRDAPFYRVRMQNGEPNSEDVARAATRSILIEATLV